MSHSDFGNLTGLRVVVTGSSSGIGRAIAWELARGGGDVVVHCRRSVAQAELLADQIRELGRRAEVRTADLCYQKGCDEFARRAWECFDGVDVWVNNAGVDLLTTDASERDYVEKLERLFAVDVQGTILLSRWVGKRMADAGGGVIINIGWDQADRGMEGESGELFSAAKNMIMGFTRSLAVSLAPKVRVNCIAPGWIRTAWGEKAGPYWQKRVQRETPLARWGTPEDVAGMARYLASPEAAYITGQVINVNGGAVR